MNHPAPATIETSIAMDNLIVEYQPQVDLRTGQISGMEALARWRDGDRVIQPAIFLPVLERRGMMRWLTRKVTTTVLDQLTTWVRQGIAVPVGVNLDAETIHDAGFVAWLRWEIASRRLDPAYLKFEVVETCVVEGDTALETLHELSRMGIHLSMDDYGTGYSSLARMRKLPIDEAKIDRSFIGWAVSEWRAQRIVKAMVRLAHDLGITVVAEGIESELSRGAAKRFGCDKGQGFLFGASLPAEDAGLALEDSSNQIPDEEWSLPVAIVSPGSIAAPIYVH